MISNKEMFKAIEKGLSRVGERIDGIEEFDFYDDLIEEIERLQDEDEEDIYGEVLYNKKIGESMKNTVRDLGYAEIEMIVAEKDNDGYKQNSIDELIIQFTGRFFHDGFDERNEYFDDIMDIIKDYIYELVEDY